MLHTTINTGDYVKYKVAANEHIPLILDSLGIEYTERYSYIQTACPIHKGDNKTAWSWHIEKGIYQCFSKGCHDRFGKDIYGLICGILDCNREQALDFLRKLFGNDVASVDLAAYREKLSNKHYIATAPRHKTKYVNSILNQFTYHQYLESRGYPRELIESYQIGYAGQGYSYMTNRIIVPVRDIDFSLVGFSGRTLYPDWKERGIPKWQESKGFDKSLSLFNIDRARPYIEKLGTAVIVEGPLDVLRLEQAGIHNGVAILGRKLHNGQIGLLLRSSVGKLILALDSDTAGRTGMEDAMRIGRNFFSIQVVALAAKDVGETSVEELRRLFVKYVS
jgi:DNA primase